MKKPIKRIIICLLLIFFGIYLFVKGASMNYPRYRNYDIISLDDSSVTIQETYEKGDAVIKRVKKPPLVNYDMSDKITITKILDEEYAAPSRQTRRQIAEIIGVIIISISLAILCITIKK